MISEQHTNNCHFSTLYLFCYNPLKAMKARAYVPGTELQIVRLLLYQIFRKSMDRDVCGILSFKNKVNLTPPPWWLLALDEEYESQTNSQSIQF